MKSTKLSTTKNGLTFTRWHYTGEAKADNFANSPDALNATSPWETTVKIAYLGDGMEPTGEQTGAVIEIYPVAEAIRIEGADCLGYKDAVAFQLALDAATELLRDFREMSTCQRHGLTTETDSDALCCEACFLEQEAELAAEIDHPVSQCNGECDEPDHQGGEREADRRAAIKQAKGE